MEQLLFPVRSFFLMALASWRDPLEWGDLPAVKPGAGHLSGLASPLAVSSLSTLLERGDGEGRATCSKSLFGRKLVLIHGLG